MESVRPVDVVRLRRWFGAGSEAVTVPAGESGWRRVEMEEIGRIELEVGASSGYMLAGGERQPMPIGSTLKGGIFYWQPGPGFVGTYRFVFVGSVGAEVRVEVQVKPKIWRSIN